MADAKKTHFSKSPILKIFSPKYLRWVLGLVGLNDAKGIDVAQRIWPWGCPTKAQKQPKNAFSVLFRYLILLNPCGREAGWHKLKNGLKTQKIHFLPVFELTLASLTAIWVAQNQCPSHQSILLTQGLIHEIFMKKYWELAELENEVFLRRPFWIFKVGHFDFFFLLHLVKNPALLYEVSIFSALWMIFPESWKRSSPNFFVHDCSRIVE